MALKRSKLSQIPQRNKDLAFGYVHEKEKENKMAVPEIIKYLCLVYFNSTDLFDPDQHGDAIQINGNSMIAEMNAVDVENVYLKNVVSAGIHVWKFKSIGDCDELGTPDMIGIFNMEYNHLIGKHDGRYFDNYYDTDKCACICHGYGFASDGILTNEEDPSDWGKKYGDHGWKKDDIIEMRLDFNKQYLKFKVNEKGYGVAFEIDATKKWKAAISVGQRGACKAKFELISYRKLY